MTDREQAIAYAEEHRQTHVEWERYWTQVAEGESPHDIDESYAVEHLDTPQGSALFHRDCVERYDLILKVLRDG